MKSMLKSRLLKFSSEMIRRIWKRIIPAFAQVYDSKITIWDSGDIRYERHSDGREMAWKIIDRLETESGFEELLHVLPLHMTPTRFVWSETILVNDNSNGFTLPGWSVTVIDKNHNSGDTKG